VADLLIPGVGVVQESTDTLLIPGSGVVEAQGSGETSPYSRSDAGAISFSGAGTRILAMLRTTAGEL